MTCNIAFQPDDPEPILKPIRVIVEDLLRLLGHHETIVNELGDILVHPTEACSQAVSTWTIMGLNLCSTWS